MSTVTDDALQGFRAVVATVCLMLGQAPSVDPILDRLGRLAQLYRDHALQFTCDERIDYQDRSNVREIHDFEYIYVYDDARGLLDYRTLPHAGVKKGAPPAEIDPANYRLPFFVRRADSWIFIFEPGKRRLYRYALEGKETVHGRQAWRVRFEPIPPYEPDFNDWVGTAWVDAEDSQLLRIKAQKVDQRKRKLEFERLVSGADPIKDHAGEIYSFWEVVADFKEQKNDLAFPDVIVSTRKECTAKPGGRGIKSKCWHAFTVNQTYSNYRFFSVRTREEIREFLSGGPASALPPASPPSGDTPHPP